MSDTTMPSSVLIREVGPRDGLQIEEPIGTEEKIRFLDALVRTGVQRIEATAFVSPSAVPALADADQVAAYVGELAQVHPEIEFSALVANLRGAERALAGGITSLEYVISAGEGHSRANSRRSTTEALQAVPEIAALVHGAGGTLEVIVATAWDCPFDGPTPVRSTVQICAQAVDAGADQLCLGDTIGTTVPGRVTRLVDAVRGVAPGTPLGVHFHNTRGSGIASAWAAVSAGVTMIDSAASGLGGCPFAPGASGNIATEELVYLLEDSGVATGIDLDAALAAAAIAEELVGHQAGSQLLRAGGRSRPQSPTTINE